MPPQMIAKNGMDIFTKDSNSWNHGAIWIIMELEQDILVNGAKHCFQVSERTCTVYTCK